MSQNGKWLEGVSPDADVADVARRALKERLAVVVQRLPAAAYCSELDVEFVHQLRVGTRRATAARRLFRLWLPPKRNKRVKKWLKQIRRAAGEARDLDVLRARLERDLAGDSHGVLQQLIHERTEAQPEIVRVADRARKKDRLQRDFQKLLDGIDPCCNKRSCDECAPFEKWARRRLGRLSREFFDKLPTSDDPAVLHQFRIQAKELRYALELIAPVLGGELREKQYPLVETLQDHLGAVNDHIAAAARLAQWGKRETSKPLASRFHVLAERELRLAEEARREFQDWWTDDRINSLRRGLTLEKCRRDRTILGY